MLQMRERKCMKELSALRLLVLRRWLACLRKTFEELDDDKDGRVKVRNFLR